MENDRDIVEIIRPHSTGNASVMIHAWKLHKAADEIKKLREWVKELGKASWKST